MLKQLLQLEVVFEYEREEDGELTIIKEKNKVQKGCKGEVGSMGWSSVEGFRNSYHIRFFDEGNEITVSIYEEDTESLLELTY